MYYPYFRGKQFELITIRESSSLMAASGFIPIVEPVKESLGGLQKALDLVVKANGKAIVIVNPFHGDHKEGGDEISKLFKSDYSKTDSISAGILLKNDMTVDNVKRCLKNHEKHRPTFIHAGFLDGKSLADNLGDVIKTGNNIFFEAHCSKLYRKHFAAGHRILLRDGFKKRKNSDYPPLEDFSDLHVTYEEEGMDGFGDFLIVGDDFSEGGGPAYAVAIHITFIDSAREDIMCVHHFVSKTRNTPTDPAGKFGEALEILIQTLDGKRSSILESGAIAEFRDLHKKGHFPGLGHVKKLSMKHHIETLASFLKK